MANQTITGGVTAVTNAASTYAQAVVKNTTLVNSANLNPNAAVTVGGGTFSAGINGAAIIAGTNSAPVTLLGGIVNNVLLAGNDVAGSTLQVGTGTGQTVVGGANNFIGTSTTSGGSAVIYGGTSNTIYAAAGSNTVAAGGGNNTLMTAGGSNLLSVGNFSTSNDTVVAGGGNNLVSVGGGQALVGATAGKNTVIGGTGNSTLIAAGGNNTLYGGTGNTTIQAGTTGQLLVGGLTNSGTTFLIGSTGNDILVGGKNTTVMQGNGGTDFFMFSSVLGGGKHVIADFGSGIDFIAVSGYNTTAAALAASAVRTGSGMGLTLSDGTQIFVAGVSSLSASNFLVS